MNFPGEIRTMYDREDLEGVDVTFGGVEWEQNDRRLAMERAAALRAASPRIEAERIRPARLDHMSLPTAEVTVDGEPAVRPRVRSHEVRSYGPMTGTDWFFLITGLMLVVAWTLLLLAVFVAVIV